MPDALPSPEGSSSVWIDKVMKYEGLILRIVTSKLKDLEEFEDVTQEVMAQACRDPNLHEHRRTPRRDKEGQRG